ncbi:non-ribosomal peptide synthetase [Kitasatospora sp. NPDC101801]|uniref:non-ribosomal peptide synthetase n=1 Tax=Kitasatospora sp. NPDC101801 TaxID=3364103 RepID=UPI0037F75B8D
MTVQQISVVDAIARAVQDNPDGSAIETTAGAISYREFDEYVRDFASRLESLTAPDEFVGIEASRTSGSIVAMVGALTAGRPFVFIDPRDSAASNRRKVSSLGINVVAADHAAGPAPRLGAVPAEWQDGDGPRQAPADLARYRGTLGYAIHTSGSTGEPKCVLVRAEPLVPMIRDHVRRLELDTRSRTLQFARLTFDGCITEILWTLTSGACLVILGEEHLAPGAVLQRTLETHRITHLKTTPFALTATAPSGAMALRHVVNGGGACRQAVLRKWSPVAKFHNAYGLTETTVCNFLSEPLDPERCRESVPLGDLVGDCGYDIRPLTGPAGSPATRGELVITGDSVAVGYLTPDGVRPFLDERADRVYPTGDIVELRDGQVHFVERLDRQLKVRGYRLDPGEVESAACRLAGVVESVVTAESHESGDDSAADALVCYYLGTASSRELRSHLEAVLDPYKVPSVIQRIEAMPYTRNGKVDREALRAGRRAAPEAAAAGTPQEQVLDLVRRLTGVDDAALDDNFFDLGGDSASTVILVGKLKELGWMAVGVRDVLRAESLRTLVDELRERSA